jgi:hypothetical protein
MAYNEYGDDEYDGEYWINNNNNVFPLCHQQQQHHEQTHTQHFHPANVSVSTGDHRFPNTAPPNVSAHPGGYESSEMSNNDILEALQAQAAQLSLLMTKLPEHLQTPLTRQFVPPTPTTVPSTSYYPTPAPPDLLNDETLFCFPLDTYHSQRNFAPVSPPRRPPTFYGPLSPIESATDMSYSVATPPHVNTISSELASTPLVSTSSVSTNHVTTPEVGTQVHLAEHQAIDRIVFGKGELPLNLLIQVYFIRTYQHAR